MTRAQGAAPARAAPLVPVGRRATARSHTLDIYCCTVRAARKHRSELSEPVSARCLAYVRARRRAGAQLARARVEDRKASGRLHQPTSGRRQATQSQTTCHCRVLDKAHNGRVCAPDHVLARELESTFQFQFELPQQRASGGPLATGARSAPLNSWCFKKDNHCDPTDAPALSATGQRRAQWSLVALQATIATHTPGPDAAGWRKVVPRLGPLTLRLQFGSLAAFRRRQMHHHLAKAPPPLQPRDGCGHRLDALEALAVDLGVQLARVVQVKEFLQMSRLLAAVMR